MRRIPSIKSVMTPFPYSIEAHADVSKALEMMHEHEIQHLPVVDHGRLVGLLWDRDIEVAHGVHDEPPPRPIPVGKVCDRRPYVVDMSERLDHVASDMAHSRVGAAIVLREQKLVGILTTTDVCRLLAESLRAQYHVPDGDGDGDAA